MPEGIGPRILGVRPLAGLEGSVIFRLTSGLPYSRSDSTGDTLVGLPNGSRLPYNSSLDLLIRRALKLGHVQGGIYLDVRNLLDRQNIVAVRRDTGEPGPDDRAIGMLAEAAYAAHPEPIPFESPRYRRAADIEATGSWKAGTSCFRCSPRRHATSRRRSSPTGRRGW